MKTKTIEVVRVDAMIDFLLEYRKDVIEALENVDSVELEDMININVPVLKCKAIKCVKNTH